MTREQAILAGWDGVGELAERLADHCPCDTCRASRPDRTRPRVMRATSPAADESLLGVVAGCAARANLETTRPLLAEAGALDHWIKNLALREDVDFAQLAFACRLAPHEVEARRYRRVEISPFLPGYDFHGAAVPVYDLQLGVRRLAPAALRAWPRHSALGHHGIATHCPETGQVLIERCPWCDRKLGWAVVDMASCSRCGRDLREHDGGRLPEDTLASTRTMIDLIHPDPARHRAILAALPPCLADMNRGAAFELGWRMGCVTTGRGVGDRDGAQFLPLADRLAILTAGGRALESWPSSASVALMEGVSADGAPSAARIHEIRLIARAQNAWPAVRDAVFVALPALATSTTAVIKSALPGGVRGTEVQKAIGVSRNEFRRLRKSTRLAPVHDTGDVHRSQVFTRDHMDELRSALADRISFTSAGWLLGVSRHGVEQLCCLDALTLLDEGVTADALDQPHVRREGVDRLVADLSDARRWAKFDEGHTLRRAMLAVGGREKPWGPAFLAMRQGDLAFRMSADGRALSDRLVIAVSDLGRLRALAFDERAHPDFPFHPHLSRTDMEDLLNLSPRSFQEVLNEGEIAADASGRYDRASIRDLAREYISGGEILMRWCGGGRSKPAIFRGKSRLIRAAKLGWSRRQVETAMSEATVTESVRHGRRRSADPALPAPGAGS